MRLTTDVFSCVKGMIITCKIKDKKVISSVQIRDNPLALNSFTLVDKLNWTPDFCLDVLTVMTAFPLEFKHK